MFRINNDRFSKKLPFITTEEMLSVYVNFCRSDYRFRNHRIEAPQRPQQHQSSHTQQQQQQQHSQPSQQNSKARNKTCKYFNSATHTCLRNKLEDGSACTDKGGLHWKHVCSKVLSGGNLCGQVHPEYDHPTN